MMRGAAKADVVRARSVVIVASRRFITPDAMGGELWWSRATKRMRPTKTFPSLVILDKEIYHKYAPGS